MKRITPDTVRRRVEHIRRLAEATHDYSAQQAERNLHKDVLIALTVGKCVNPCMCAVAALGTAGIEMVRWDYGDRCGA